MERLLSYRDLKRETTLSESSVRRLIAEGRFPKPEKLGPGRVVFREGAVRDAVERLLAEHSGPEAA